MSSNIVIEHDGQRLTSTQWAARIGRDDETIRWRFRSGWDAADIVSPHDRRFK